MPAESTQELQALRSEFAELKSLITGNLPLLRNVSDRTIAKAEAVAFTRSLKRQTGELARLGTTGLRLARGARRKARREEGE